MLTVIIPYRQRPNQLFMLLQRLQMFKQISRIVVCEQSADGKPFNRGWCKNAGFLLAAVPSNQTVYFHDVDLLPGAAFFGYPVVEPGTVRHLYGHQHCLGGIVGFCAADFERVNGFCNELWTWGGEDRMLTEECKAIDLDIDRSLFAFRFSYNKVIGEMDDQGRVMDDKLAKELFICDIRNKKKVVPDTSSIQERSQLHATRFITESHVQTGIVDHYVVQIIT